MSVVAEAAGERLAGGRPSRLRALVAAVAVGAGAAALTYRLLRSAPE
jgi:hypothetical protein